MTDRVFADCPHCGNRNTYALAELEQVQPAARWVFRPSPSQRPPEPQEYIVTCQQCGQSFKIVVNPVRM